MNKHTREHYPAHKLPDDLRGQIDPSKQVTVTIVEEVPPSERRSLEEIFESTKQFRTLSSDQIIASVRALREELE